MFKFKHLFIICISIALLAGAGCKSRYEKIRLSNDVAKKLQEAMRLYNKKSYSKALILFEDLAQKYRGQQQAEDLNYYYAYTLYRMYDYTTARFQFKYFAETYPTSRNAEEARYMAAYCFYLDSPEYSLDQENTYKAIDALQLFMNLYPRSDRAKLAADYITILRNKLETKAYDNAKMYYLMGDYDISNYKSAVIALKNAQIDYPDIKFADEMTFLIFKSQHLYAKNSFVNRQEERYLEGLTYYREFVEAFPNSKFKKEADELKKDAEEGIIAAKKEMAQIALDTQKFNELQRKSRQQDSLNNIKTIKTPVTPVNNG
ncbi:MAG: outer membrane protein assembly factor BamD [Pedobacter sp.]|nr:MAG: outer membrane protein assembly factor BamD [Pedobacter sp.]